MSIKQNIKARGEFRQKITERERELTSTSKVASLLISESLDDYIEHRIEADKVLEGILKDIQGNIAGISENGIAIDKREE